MATKTWREQKVARKDSYISYRKENKKLREGLNLISRQVACVSGKRKFRLGVMRGLLRCAEIAESYLEGGDDEGGRKETRGNKHLRA